MEHRFFKRSKKAQKLFLVKIGVSLFLFCATIITIALFLELYILFFLLPLALLIMAPFIDLPQGKANGKFIYHSPVFISEKAHNETISVHGGTLFDYVFTITPSMSVVERKRFILRGYLIGFIKLLETYENEPEHNYTIKGTSYILNERTGKRFGFQLTDTDPLQYLILLFNYIPLTISNSIIEKKLHFPRISEIKTFKGKISELSKHKRTLIQLEKRLVLSWR